MTQPQLLDAPYVDVDSMLVRRFGREIVNYFAGSPLNRVSFLRTDHTFLSAAISHRTAAFLLFNELAPLTDGPAKLAYADYEDVRPVIGQDVYTKTEDQMIATYNSNVYVPQLVFLGLDPANSDGLHYKTYTGAPYFALDVTPKHTIADKAQALIDKMKARGYDFLQTRMQSNLSAKEAAIYAHARCVIDWNARNPFCAQCGQPTLSINAGHKRTCPPTDASMQVDSLPRQRPSCLSRKGVTNISFPRTDPTIIVAVVSHDGRKILLGRQKKWPPHWYSTLAGFVECAESVEEAVRREVWEEAGVTLGRVVLHSTQPWPFPANLMIGAVAQTVSSGEEIRLSNDPELEDAKWWTFDDVREALRTGTSGIGEGPGKEYKSGSLRLPPSTAIAHQLIKAVVVGGFLGGESKI